MRGRFLRIGDELQSFVLLALFALVRDLLCDVQISARESVHVHFAFDHLLNFGRQRPQVLDRAGLVLAVRGAGADAPVDRVQQEPEHAFGTFEAQGHGGAELQNGGPFPSLPGRPRLLALSDGVHSLQNLQYVGVNWGAGSLVACVEDLDDEGEVFHHLLSQLFGQRVIRFELVAKAVTQHFQLLVSVVCVVEVTGAGVVRSDFGRLMRRKENAEYLAADQAHPRVGVKQEVADKVINGAELVFELF